MRKILPAFFCFITVACCAQREKFYSLALTNNHTAYPFQSFSKLFTKELHPGFLAAYGFNWKSKPKHDLYQEFTVGYFYHQFVQHAIPLYSSFGYRYKSKGKLGATVSLGAGYLHSIPDADVYKLDSEGEYENGKGIGRGQIMIKFSMGPEYKFNMKDRSMDAFIRYEQMLQTPFIKSYVPLLPYNSLAIGIKTNLKTSPKK